MPGFSRVGSLAAPGRKRHVILYLAATFAIFCLFFSSLMAGGGYFLSPGELFALFEGQGTVVRQIALLELRLPRALLAALAGASLGAAGSIMQGVTRNPIASPGLTGVISSGALAVVIFRFFFPATLSYAWFPVGAFLGGIVGGLLCFWVAGRQSASADRIVLAGIAVMSLSSSIGTGVLVASGSEAAELYYWLAGSLTGRGWAYFWPSLPWLILPLIVACCLGAPLRLLLLDDDVGQSIGFSVLRWRMALFCLAVVMSAAVVSVAGPVIFVGLVAPHLARALCGNGSSHHIALSALAGALVLLAADLIARQAIYPQELPAGMVTALVGGPWLIVLLLGLRRGSHAF